MVEVFGVGEYLHYNIWILLLMEEQEYEIKHNIIFQYNHSVIGVEKNGTK